MTHSHLCRAAARGDRAAFEALVHAHGRTVWSVATAIVGDPEIGREVAQDAFVAAWQGLGRLRDPERFRPWLLEIVRNRARDARRRRAAHDVRPLLADPADPRPDLGDQLDEAAREATVWSALDALRPDDREVLLLFYREGASIRTVAQALDLSEVAVRKRLSRARERLRADVQAHLAPIVERRTPELGPWAAAVVAALGTLGARSAWAAGVGAAMLLLVLGAGVGGLEQARATLPPIAPVPERHGITVAPWEPTTPPDPAAVPEHVVHAFLAAEDARFFEHGGIDLWAVARATWHTLAGDGVQGGSTITQQLAKHELRAGTASGEAPRSLVRKGLEALMAWELERQLPKHEILARYLDEVYFGAGARGLSEAAETYFGTTPRELSIADAALLAGLVAAPSDRNPLAHPQAARQARQDVLERMQRHGWATAEEVRAGRQAPLPSGDLSP